MDAEVEKLIERMLRGLAYAEADGLKTVRLDDVRPEVESLCDQVRAAHKALYTADCRTASMAAENAELKAEIERLREELDSTIRDAREVIWEADAEARAMAADMERMEGY